MNNVHVDHLVSVPMTRKDASLLLDVLLGRPHDEEWSNNVVAALGSALAPPPTNIIELRP